MPPIAELVLYVFSFLYIIWLLYRVNALREERNSLTQQKDVVMSFMHDIAEVFTEEDVVDTSVLLKRILFYAMRTTHAGAGAIYILDEEDNTLHARAMVGVFPPLAGDLDSDMQTAFSKVRYVQNAVRERSFKVGEGLVGAVANDSKPILIEDAEEDPRVPRYAADFLCIDSMLLIPMRFHNKVQGVLAVVNRVDDMPFTPNHLDMLQALCDQASVSIHHARVSAVVESNRRLNYDLSIASQIQEALLPKEIPELPGIELSAFCVPAQKIGGDYYDFIPIDDKHMGIVVADVSGKGVAAGLVMSICRSVLRLEARGSTDPAAVLRRVNAQIRENVAEDMFISLLYMVFSLDKPEVVVARAGHTEPIVQPLRDADPWLIHSKGMAMGMVDEDIFDSVIVSERVSLNRGDKVFAFTDGVTEAQGAGQTEWGLMNLMKTVHLLSLDDDRDIAETVSGVKRKLVDFTGDAPQYDDMTLVALKYL